MDECQLFFARKLKIFKLNRRHRRAKVLMLGLLRGGFATQNDKLLCFQAALIQHIGNLRHIISFTKLYILLVLYLLAGFSPRLYFAQYNPFSNSLYETSHD